MAGALKRCCVLVGAGFRKYPRTRVLWLVFDLGALAVRFFMYGW